MVKTAGDERKDTAELQVLNRTTTTLLEDRRGALCAKLAVYAISPPAGRGDQRPRQSHGGVGFFPAQRPMRRIFA
jgi:hypothetical protein